MSLAPPNLGGGDTNGLCNARAALRAPYIVTYGSRFFGNCSPDDREDRPVHLKA